MEKKAFIFFCLACLAFGCAKKQAPVFTSIYGLDYYPTTEGRFVIYDVDSILYQEIPKDTTVYKFRIKEKIADSFTDNLGRPAIRLERYIKKFSATVSYDNIPWTMKEVWMVNADNKNIQVVEGNVRFTKLTFPVELNATWNGNANNTQGEQIYSYTHIDSPETINNVTLDKVLQVRQKEFRTLISYDKHIEKYAKGVGLVYREINNLLSNTIVQNVPVEDRIESGLIYKQTLVTYGYE